MIKLKVIGMSKRNIHIVIMCGCISLLLLTFLSSSMSAGERIVWIIVSVSVMIVKQVYYVLDK